MQNKACDIPHAMNLVAHLKELVQKERELNVEILRGLRAVEDGQEFARLGYKDMHIFCMEELGYSYPAADRRVRAMRLGRTQPQVEEKLATGAINLTTAAEIQRRVVEADAKNLEFPVAELIEKVSGDTVRGAESIIKQEAKAAGLEVKEDPKEELLADLVAFYSHKNMSREDIILMLVQREHERILPSRERKKSAHATEQDPEKRTVKTKLRREVFVRDRSRCTYVSKTGKRCSATHHLEIDHIVPFAHGGLSKLSNLRLLCRTHNQLLAREAGLQRPLHSGAGKGPPPSQI